MRLSTKQVETIVEVATSYIGHPYSEEFNCVDFVRRVYESIGVKIPKLRSCAPPTEFNVQREQLEDPPIGHLIFLVDRADPRKERAWTHVAIIMPNHNCIHCTLFNEKKVVISSLAEMFRMYDFAESLIPTINRL